MSTVSIISRVVWRVWSPDAAAYACWLQRGHRCLRSRVGKAAPRKGRTGPRVSPAGTAASAWALMPRLSAPTTASPTTARSIAARTRAVVAVRTSIAAVPRIATPTGGAHPRRPTHRSTHEAWATRVRPPTSVGAPRLAPFASTPSRPMTLAAAGTRVRCAPLAPSAVAHESVPVEFANSSTAARTAARVSAAAPRARGKAAPACCTATQNAAPAARCTTPALRGSSVPGPAKTSGLVFRPRPAPSTSSRATTARATAYRHRPSAGAAALGTARTKGASWWMLIALMPSSAPSRLRSTTRDPDGPSLTRGVSLRAAVF
jgi:hypothetical protein